MNIHIFPRLFQNLNKLDNNVRSATLLCGGRAILNQTLIFCLMLRSQHLVHNSRVGTIWIKYLLNRQTRWCFQRDGTVQLFGTKGQKFLHCPETKGQQDKLKILPRDGRGQPKFRTGRAGIAKIWDRTRDKTGQSRKGRIQQNKMTF